MTPAGWPKKRALALVAKGRRSFALPEFDPFWARVQELDIVVGMHSGDPGYTQAGFTQLAPTSVPEPSSLTLLASSIPAVLGLVWLRRRKVAVFGSWSKIETRT